MREVLWLEDDVNQIGFALERLRERRIKVRVARSVSEAEQDLKRQGERIKLFVVDNLVPDGRDDVPKTESDQKGSEFILEARRRGLYVGAVLLLSYFTPSEEKRKEIESGGATVRVIDKHRIRLSEVVDAISGMLGKQGDESGPGGV